MSFDGMGRRDITITHQDKEYKFIHFLESFSNTPPKLNNSVVLKTGKENNLVIPWNRLLIHADMSDRDMSLVLNSGEEFIIPSDVIKKLVLDINYLYQYEYTETLILRLHKKITNKGLSIEELDSISEKIKEYLEER